MGRWNIIVEINPWTNFWSWVNFKNFVVFTMVRRPVRKKLHQSIEKDEALKCSDTNNNAVLLTQTKKPQELDCLSPQSLKVSPPCLFPGELSSDFSSRSFPQLQKPWIKSSWSAVVCAVQVLLWQRPSRRPFQWRRVTWSWVWILGICFCGLTTYASSVWMMSSERITRNRNHSKEQFCEVKHW